MKLTTDEPQAVYLAELLAEREWELAYEDLEDEFLRFIEKDNKATRKALHYLGILLYFYRHKDEEGRCEIDLGMEAETIYGDSGIVAAFRVYCMLEHFTRKGWIHSRVGAFKVLATLEEPTTRIDLTLTDEGMRAGNAMIWRDRLKRSGGAGSAPN